MVLRVVRSLVRRAQAGDINALEELVRIQAAVGQAIPDAARGLHAEPGLYSWGEIGRWLGMTRQAAQQRFGQ